MKVICDINKKGSLESLLDSRKRVADEKYM